MNKLVRDEIPRVIPADKLSFFKFTTLNDAEYAEELKKKLLEEVHEYIQAENMEELADIYEVLEAIIKFKSFNHKDIDLVKQNKRDERGGFEKCLLMQSIV